MCNDCFNGCDEQLTSDRCVKYTGPDVDSLGICEGDNLKIVEGKIIDKIVTLSDGSGITLNPTLGCLSTAVGTDKTLPNIIQKLITAYCSTKSTVTTLSGQVNTPYAFDKKCLSFSSTASRDIILQSVITKLCTIDSSLTTVSGDYVKASDLNTLIADFLNSSTSTATVTQQSLKMVPYVAYEYYGSMSNFDATGEGLESLGYKDVYVCNGSHNTPDKRGRVAVGATVGVPGGAFDSAVDPALPANAGYAYGLKNKFGSINTTLFPSQLPSHSHSVTDPGHTHPYFTILTNGGGFGDGLASTHSHGDESNPNKTTSKSVTGISIDNTGDSQPHSNIQPSIAANFIIHLPS